MPETKKKIAIFSPFNPIKSGVSDYVEQFIKILIQFYDIDAFVDGYTPNSRLYSEVSFFQRKDFEWRVRQVNYETVVYQMGNSQHHSYMYPVLFRYPGLVVLHDANLHRSRAFHHLKNNKLGCYLDEMEYCHGSEGKKAAWLIAKGLESKFIFDRFHMLNPVCEAATNMIVHNCYSQQVICEFMPNVSVNVVPMLYSDIGVSNQEQAKYNLKINSDKKVIASFGFIAPGKGLEIAIETVQKIMEKEPDCLYFMVGDYLDSDYKNVIQNLIEPKYKEKIIVTGYVDQTKFLSYLAAADVCLNLRYPTQGETSSALLKIMGAGKPVIIPLYRQFSEIPRDACVHIDLYPDEAASLYFALEMLIQNADLRDRIGSLARQYVLSNHSIERWANGIIEAVETSIENQTNTMPLSKRIDLEHIKSFHLTDQIAIAISDLKTLSSNEKITKTLMNAAMELGFE